MQALTRDAHSRKLMSIVDVFRLCLMYEATIADLQKNKRSSARPAAAPAEEQPARPRPAAGGVGGRGRGTRTDNAAAPPAAADAAPPAAAAAAPYRDFEQLAEPAATRLLSMYVRVEPLLPFVVLAILVFFFFYFFSRFQTVDA